MNESGETGVYYDERGHPMLGSTLVRDAKFTFGLFVPASTREQPPISIPFRLLMRAPLRVVAAL
jgi:hypothetical protein